MAHADDATNVIPLHDPDPRDWLAAIIEGSDDAIISKDLSGRIQSWNNGAVKIFGYTAEEAIGQPITMLIPDDRLNEEPSILAKISSGERVDHFETLRRRKDGSLVDLSLTISPIRGASGDIVGASKIARDISEKRLAEQNQRLLIGEMHHRVKNLFAVASAIVSLAAREETTKDGLVKAILARLSALARAHQLTAEGGLEERPDDTTGDLQALIETVLAPFGGGDRIRIEGDLIAIGSHATTNLALLIYEFATNAAKYGSLSAPKGRLTVRLVGTTDGVQIDWTEFGGPAVHSESAKGFGSHLAHGLATALGATITRDWRATGLAATISIPEEALRI